MTNYLNVPGAQVTKKEKQRIHELAALSEHDFKPPTIVNIGIMWGCTLWCLRDGAPTATLYGVDIAPNNWPITDLPNLSATILEGDSRTLDFDGPINLLLIDGDHHYATVSADIKNWAHRVAPGGTLIFHDYNPTAHNLSQFPELEGVHRAVDEWAAQNPDWRQVWAPDSLAVFERSK